MTAGAVGTHAVPAAAQGDFVQTEVHSPLAALLCGMVLLLILCNEHILAKNPQSDCLLPAGAGAALLRAGEVAPGRTRSNPNTRPAGTPGWHRSAGQPLAGLLLSENEGFSAVNILHSGKGLPGNVQSSAGLLQAPFSQLCLVIPSEFIFLSVSERSMGEKAFLSAFHFSC